MSDIWIPGFITASPILAPLAAVAALFNDKTDWPSLDALNAARDLVHNAPKSANQCRIRFVPQARSCDQLEEKYEPRIFLKGEVQTRMNNWHDFFNALVWMTFPHTKSVLNALQYEQFLHADREQQTNRTPVQDALTIFDEGGAIVASRDPALFDLLRRFAWKELFWKQRQRVQRDMQFLLFGHALYEKALTPYKGMTAKCVLLDVPADFFALPMQQQLSCVDAHTAAWFRRVGTGLRTHALSPLPILGVPGWIADNGDPRYYDDKRYFRDHYQRVSTSQHG